MQNTFSFNNEGLVTRRSSLTEPSAISVVLGEFNKPNAFGQIFHVTEDKLISLLDEKIGKDFGEMSFPELPRDIREALARLQTVDGANSAGVLLSYTIRSEDPKKKNAPAPLTVIGDIIPSKKLQDAMDEGVMPYFGIRSLNVPSVGYKNNDLKHYNTYFIGGFDLVAEDPHPDANLG